ncbi:MAG: YihY/virulence factor BrkB family protein [Beijerinckiaceae bacterium]
MKMNNAGTSSTASRRISGNFISAVGHMRVSRIPHRIFVYADFDDKFLHRLALRRISIAADCCSMLPRDRAVKQAYREPCSQPDVVLTGPHQAGQTLVRAGKVTFISRTINKWAWAALAGAGAAMLVSRSTSASVNAGSRQRTLSPADERHAAAGSGRLADNPADIPVGGWNAILKRTYHEIVRDRVLAVAAGVTFYGLLALFPAVTAFVSFYGLIADRSAILDHLALLDTVLPMGAVDIIRDQIIRITSGDETKLGVAFLLGAGMSLWSANAGVKAMFDALNVAYNEVEKRSFIKLNAISLAFTFAVIAFGLIAISAIAVVPAILNYLYLGALSEWIVWLGRWPLIFLILLAGLAALYRFGPSRREPKWAWVSPGAIFAATAWIVFSILFSWYVANFGEYNKTYGALGAVIALLMWLWLSVTIVLVGAELNAETERQTLRDTTRGTAKPIGLRGAVVADQKTIS